MSTASRYAWRPRAPATPDDVAGSRGSGPWAIAVITIAYLELLHWVYRSAIAPAFSYLRYTYREPDPTYYAVAVAMVVALALVLPRRIVHPSHFVVWVVFIVAVAPSIVVPQYSEVLSEPDAFEVASWVAVSFLPVAVFGTRRLVRDMLPRLTVPPSAFWIAISVVSVFVYAYVIASVGITFDLPSINDVYGVRDEYQQVEDSGSVLLSYATPLIANVINPLILARGLFARSWIWIAAGVLGQLFIYSFTGYRSALLSPIALLGAFLLLRRRSRAPSVLILTGVVVLTAGMWALDAITAGNDFTSLLVRRFLITPGLLTAGYVYVFADIPKAEFAHSFLRSFLDYPYSREPPQLVGEVFFGDASTNANANLLADGFANVGFPGMLLECLVLMVVLWFIDDACRGLRVGVAAMVFVMPTLSLVDSGLFTTLLTHGLGAAILICLLAPRSEPPTEPATRPTGPALDRLTVRPDRT
jgi:hypothetical protein